MFRSSRIWIAAIGLAVLAVLPASADIKTFNEKVGARDFKAAAAEAAATWPTLDKSRKDIAIIAREFGFAAYMAGDFAAARTFAEFAVANEPEGPDAPAQRATATVLVKMAAHKQQPTQATRNDLFSALSARASTPGMDIISYLGMDATLAYDFEKGSWKDAQASSSLGEQVTATGGPVYVLYNRRFQLFNGVATYMSTKEKSVFDKLTALTKTMIDDINAAPTDKDAAPFEDFYWDVYAWQQAIGNHLVGRNKMEWPERDKSEEAKPVSERMVRLLGKRSDAEKCGTKPDKRQKPSYPSSALYKGLTGVVVVRFDIDDKGRPSNTKVLSAVPEKYFGEAVLKSMKDFRYLPDKPWDASCSLAQQGRVMTVIFSIG
ncbi:MAG: TonB family protein [Hyphomonadaceae bacterium]